MEFIVFVDPTKYPHSQNLPQVFADDFFNGNRYVYLTSNLRYRFKCDLVKPNGRPIRITGVRWVEFCKENVRQLRLMHFIQQGEDTYYVTCYDDFGYEDGFYPGPRKRPQRFVTRVWPYDDYDQDIPPQFLQGLDHNGTITIRANIEEEFEVRVRYVETDSPSGKYKYRLLEEDWNAMVNGLGLESGMVVVLTKEQNNRLYLMAFTTEGNQVTIPDFRGLTNIKKIQRPLYTFEEGDKRLQHICLWPGHHEHFGERYDTFYKAYNLTVDKQRLPIPASFLYHHPMHTYSKVLLIHQNIEYEMVVKMDHHTEDPTRENHVNILGKWKEFAGECNFGLAKMLRFKLFDTFEGLNGDEDSVPVFHVC